MGFLPALQPVQDSAFLRGLKSLLMGILSSCSFLSASRAMEDTVLCHRKCFGCFEYDLLELEVPWVFMEEADGWRGVWKMQSIDCLAEKQ